VVVVVECVKVKNRLLVGVLFASFFLSEAFGEEKPLTSNEKSAIVECFKRLKRKINVQAGEVMLVDAISQVMLPTGLGYVMYADAKGERRILTTAQNHEVYKVLNEICDKYALEWVFTRSEGGGIKLRIIGKTEFNEFEKNENDLFVYNRTLKKSLRE